MLDFWSFLPAPQRVKACFAVPNLLEDKSEGYSLKKTQGNKTALKNYLSLSVYKYYPKGFWSV